MSSELQSDIKSLLQSNGGSVSYFGRFIISTGVAFHTVVVLSYQRA